MSKVLVFQKRLEETDMAEILSIGRQTLSSQLIY